LLLSGVWLGALGVGVLANPAFLQPLNLYHPARLPHSPSFIVLVIISIKSAGRSEAKVPSKAEGSIKINQKCSALKDKIEKSKKF